MTRILNLELLFPALILVAISLTTLLTLDRTLFLNQLLFTGLGLLAFMIFSWVDYRIFKNLMLPIFIVSIISLFIVLIIGTQVRGAIRWFDLFSFRIQISEILKPFLILTFSSFLTSREGKITFPIFLLSLVFIGIVLWPILLQPDLGNTLIYTFTSILMLIIYGIPLSWFAIPGVTLLIFSPIIWHFLHDYQKQRVLSFLNPAIDPQGASYNLIQSVITVGGGGLFGRGLGHGTQSQLKFLPERHTDFIFATIAENLGFLGTMLIVATFIFLLFKIYKLIKETEDTYAKVFSIGAFLLILLQAFINIGGNIGIIPITGITLPLLSYGGSSLLSTFILLGILNSISQGAGKPHKTLEIR